MAYVAAPDAAVRIRHMYRNSAFSAGCPIHTGRGLGVAFGAYVSEAEKHGPRLHE